MLAACRGKATPRDNLQLADAQQLRLVGETLSRTLKLRQDPFEWVYEGFHPLLLPSVLVTR